MNNKDVIKNQFASTNKIKRNDVTRIIITISIELL